MPHRKLSRLWCRITAGSKIVDIRPIRAPQKAATDVARYASAPADLVSNKKTDYVEIFESLHKRKTCGTWGTARSVLLKQPAATDKDKWRSVGSWSLVREMNGYSDEADAIVKAWLTSTPLEEGVSMRGIERFMMNAVIEGVFEKPVRIQSTFFDT